LKSEFERQDTSIYSVFFGVLPALVEAHKAKDTLKIARIYDFAEWCFRQKEKDLWNAAGVAFYEHLGDYEETLKEFPQWIKPNIYADIRGLLELRLEDTEVQKLDNIYGFRAKRK
jgi:hypothetical protein